MLLQFIAGIGSTVGYALIFNQPRRHLIPTGLIGAAGWILYLVAVEVGYGDAFASFLSAFLVTFLSQIAARLLKDPVMVFCIPGIMPIVPGATISMAGAIALGLLAATSLFQVMTAVNRTFFKK